MSDTLLSAQLEQAVHALSLAVSNRVWYRGGLLIPRAAIGKVLEGLFGLTANRWKKILRRSNLLLPVGQEAAPDIKQRYSFILLTPNVAHLAPKDF